MQRIAIIVLTLAVISCSEPKSDYLVKVDNDPGSMGTAGYATVDGKMIIPIGKYFICFSDTLKNFAIVMTHDKRLIGINRNEKELFEVFWFDNGPDYVSDGLFRIVKDGKIGYADATGKIVINPQYDCAEPFEHGVAKVSTNCTRIKGEEHVMWESDQWETIRKDGSSVKNESPSLSRKAFVFLSGRQAKRVLGL